MAMDTGTFDWDGFEPMELGIPTLKVETRHDRLHPDT